jgi:glycosyltransferase involved in cell wall biosynthesis
MPLSQYPEKPFVCVTALPPNPARVSSLAEDAAEFIRRHVPDREQVVITFTNCAEARSDYAEVKPVIDLSQADWPARAVAIITDLDPYAIHLHHEKGLYVGGPEGTEMTARARFVQLLEGLGSFPTVVEAHSVRGRLTENEEAFLARIAELCTIMVLKCDYQKWRLEWAFSQAAIEMPHNIAVIPQGARPDRHYEPRQIDSIKDELGLSDLKGKRLVGLVGWIQGNKRWDIVTNLWPEIHDSICMQTGEEWLLFAAGDINDPLHQQDFDHYVAEIRNLERLGQARFFQFSPEGEIYYKVLALCDFLVLPTLDSTQSGTLSRIIALNKPYITTAPLEGLTAMTVESEGGLLFTNRETLRRRILRLATQEDLRWRLGEKLKNYLNTKVNWDIVAKQYLNSYRLARCSKDSGMPIRFPMEFEAEAKRSQQNVPTG